jgi:hypothetical protein
MRRQAGWASAADRLPEHGDVLQRRLPMELETWSWALRGQIAASCSIDTRCAHRPAGHSIATSLYIRSKKGLVMDSLPDTHRPVQETKRHTRDERRPNDRQMKAYSGTDENV